MKDLLNMIKKILEKNYRIDSGIEDMSDFIISEKKFQMFDRLASEEVRYIDDARLLLIDDGEDLNAGLYFSEDFKKRFEENSPSKNGLNKGNIQMMGTAIEEVDHLVLLSYSLSHDKPVSKLEMELQAGIDKYLLLKSFISLQEGTFPKIRQRARSDLKAMVFGAEYDEEDTAVQWRYENAAKMGRAFIENFELLDSTEKRNKVLREFYRRSPMQKVDYITAETGAILR